MEEPENSEVIFEPSPELMAPVNEAAETPEPPTEHVGELYIYEGTAPTIHPVLAQISPGDNYYDMTVPEIRAAVDVLVESGALSPPEATTQARTSREQAEGHDDEDEADTVQGDRA